MIRAPCGHLVVRTPQTRRLLQLTGYLDVLNLHKTLEDAIRASGQAAVSATAAANEAAWPPLVT